MKITTTTARWFVSPSPRGVSLTVNGVEYLMSLSEADALAGAVDDACIFAKTLTRDTA